MPQDTFTLSIDNKILLTTSDTIEVRQKIKALKKEQTPFFTFNNQTENLTFNFTKKDNENGYWVKRDLTQKAKKP